MKRYVIVLSLDAVGSREFKILREQPNTRELLKEAAYSEEVSSVYPSITYPAHTSIVTGYHPGEHGIVNNMKLQLYMENPDWYWKRRDIKKPVLYEEAEKRGIRTAALLWPVTGGARISYNLPEILPNRPWQSQISVCMQNGTIPYELELDRRFGYLRDGVKQPRLDNFVQASMLYTIERWRPQLLLAHFTDVDTNRHIYGASSPEAGEALQRHDRRIGELVQLLKREGIYEQTTVFLLGDHSQMDVERVLYPNYWLKKNGLIEERNGRIRSFLAYASHCDGSCYIYARKGLAKEDRQRIVRAVRELQEQFPEAVQRIYTRREAQEMGADGRCACMLEAGPGWYFLNEREALTAKTTEANGLPHMMKGVHGYHPDKPEYQTFFAAAGFGVRRGKRIGPMSLVDEGPAIAAALGFSLGDTPGRDLELMSRS